MASKRKFEEQTQIDHLSQDLLETLLSFLPTSFFFRLTSVCKRWKSTTDSATFRRACSRVPARAPWFYMVDSCCQSQSPVVFDSSENKWRSLLQVKEVYSDFIPVATSQGLICFHRRDGEFAVGNPVNQSFRRLNPLPPETKSPIRAVALMSKDEFFKAIVVSGELPKLTFIEYNSIADQWGTETSLTTGVNNSLETDERDEIENCTTQYFLSKRGDVVSADFQRSPSKQYSSILTIEENQDEILHFLSSSGSVIACNLTRKVFSVYPTLLPEFSEYSIDLIESSGRMHAVLLSEFLETASLRVWCWDHSTGNWRQTAAMPPAMSHEFSGKKVDINCTATNRKMLICANSPEMCRYYTCDLQYNKWDELPGFRKDGVSREFVSALSFEPRIEASIS